MFETNTLQKGVVDRAGLQFSNDCKPLCLANPLKLATVCCGVQPALANLFGGNMDDQPPPSSTLRDSIMARRRDRYGEGPYVKPTPTLTDAEWFAQQASKPLQGAPAWQRSAKPQQVYFIQAGDGGPVKIGIAVDPARRCKDMQTGHYAKLAVVGTCPGGLAQEQAYHRQFAEHRLHGEWFSPAPDILAEIARLTGAA